MVHQPTEMVCTLAAQQLPALPPAPVGLAGRLHVPGIHSWKEAEQHIQSAKAPPGQLISGNLTS